MILDTSFIIDVLGGDDEALDFLELSERENRPEKVSAVTVLELHEGVERSDRPDDERERVLSVLGSKHVIAADYEVMRHAGELSGRLHAAGAPIDREDCIIAATALGEGEAVVTRNSKHFERIDGLDILTY